MIKIKKCCANGSDDGRSVTLAELLSLKTVDAMCECGHAGGFSLNVDVIVPAWDRGFSRSRTIAMGDLAPAFTSLSLGDAEGPHL